MTKDDAIKLLGGTAASAARLIGISPSAVSLWPVELTPAIADRVQAAIARQLLPPEKLGIAAVEAQRVEG
jgi:DNA-binding transcriptional regulator YdaS (Cro superfamily)